MENLKTVEIKSLFESKSFWFNVISLLVFVAGYFGFKEFSPNPELLDYAAKIMAVLLPLVNIALRKVTEQPVNLTKPKLLQ